ncbi:MAG: hypothetical protein ICV83_02830 [Cytophagales bacterium]|nr:hypothetical protein [Cytophagales bacterium]
MVNTRRVLILLGMLAWAGLPAGAQENTEKGALEAVIHPSYGDPFRVYVRLDNPRRRLVWVRVRNGKKENLFVDWTRRFKYNLRLNLADLPNGEYRVEVTDGRKVITKAVHIRTLYEQRTQRIISLVE